MMMAIVTGSMLKGVVTGLVAGIIAQWKRSTALGILAGLAIGFALNTGVAIAQGITRCVCPRLRRPRPPMRRRRSEGFVNQYVLDPASAPGKLVLVSEAIENIPAGWRAREACILTGTDRLEEIFELAPPGKEFEPYSRSRLARAR
jgi:hypothetical protein